MSRTTASTARDERTKVAASSLIGTTIEWFDFFIYGQAAALVFNQIFFPDLSPTVGTLVSLATLGVGFVARPLGGFIFGHFGDRIGRKSMLVLTLSLMGVATAAIGLLPTAATIGVWAPVLLVTLRVVQGVAVGGEWGGAVLMSVEHAPPGRRGLYGSIPQMGIPLGLVSSSGLYAVLSATMPEEAFLSYGWRLTFLSSVLLLVVGLVIRLKVSESPAFAAVKERGAEVRVPLAHILRRAKRAVVVGILAQAGVNVGFYVASVYILTYARDEAGLSQTESLLALVIAALVDLVAIPTWAALSDRVGRKTVFIGGAVGMGVLAFPMFALVDSGSFAATTAGIALVLAFGHAPMYATLSSFLAESFAVEVRYSGISATYQLAGALWSAPTPVVAAAIVASSGAGTLIVVMVLACVLSIGATLLMRETFRDGREARPADRPEARVSPDGAVA